MIPDTVIAAQIDTSRLTLPYLAVAWQQRSARSQIESAARTTSGIYKVNQQTLGAVQIPVPPMDVQQEFAAKLAEIESFGRRSGAHASKLDSMLSSLQSRAFSGRL